MPGEEVVSLHMNIYLHEMRSNLKSLVLWCLGMAAVIAAGMGKYAGMAESGQSVSELVESMPKIVLALLGMNGIDLGTAAGFYAVVYLYILVMLSIQAGTLGARIISKEETDKTMEFLFTRPVSRVRIISSKISAALTYALILNCSSLAVSLIMLNTVKGKGIAGNLCVMSLGLLVVQVVFIFLGTALASVGKKPSASESKASLIVLAAYMFYVLSDLSENLEFLKFFTPFKYFKPSAILTGNYPDAISTLVAIIAAGCFAVLTFVYFPKRDLTA
jgi:ABC-2 type transport system permease protein